jgi:hypothetical protein
MVAHLLVPTAGTTVVALLWLKAMETLRDQGVLSANACRKWIHVGTGPLYSPPTIYLFIYFDLF